MVGHDRRPGARVGHHPDALLADPHRRGHAGRHQVADGEEAKVPRLADVLPGYVRFRAVRCDPADTRAELGRFLDGREGAEARNQDDADPGVAYGLDRGRDERLVRS